jgi:glycosyltransferase involved in cell wall biosynthesis
VTGADVDLGLVQQARLSVLRLAGPDVARKNILETTRRRLSEKLQSMLQGRDTPDLIHCHDPLAGVAAHIALGQAAISVPVVQTVHGPASREAIMGGAAPDGRHVSCIRRLEEYSFAAATHLIAVDHGQADIMSTDFHVPVEKITVVPNGTDIAAVAALGESRSPVEIGEPYFLVPRRLVKKNGVEVALDAIASLRSSTLLAVAGNGPLRPQLERAAMALGVAHRVRFLGNLPPTVVLPLMRRALGVVIPSIPVDGVVEATSLAALESMACGTPIIASDIGGLREIVSRAKVGFLFPAGDAMALASAMRELEAMPAGELALLQRRTQTAAEAFDVRHWFSAINTVYTEAVAARNALTLSTVRSQYQ